MVHPKSTLIQPRMEREAERSGRNQKSSNEGRKGRRGKKFTRKAKGKKEIRKRKERVQEKKKLKNKKSKKAKTEKNKNRGRKKKGKKGRKSQSRSRSPGRAVTETCLETSITVMKMWKDVISNFEKQYKRMEKQNGTGSSKSGKKGEFKGAAHILLSAGGGNKSALSCGGSTDNPGAAQLKNLTDTLEACEESIHAACNASNFDLVNNTKLTICKSVADTFKTGAEECLGKTVGADKTSTDDACD